MILTPLFSESRERELATRRGYEELSLRLDREQAAFSAAEDSLAKERTRAKALEECVGGFLLTFMFLSVFRILILLVSSRFRFS